MSLTEFLESPGYKKVMAKVYGLGAAVVLAGALFKIMHYPGAELMLLLGMGTEIIIFTLSAFEPPHEMPDWSLVYPELVGLEPSASKGVVKGGSGGSDLAALVESGHLEPAVVEKLSDGIKKLSMTSSQLSDLSTASLATESYLQNMKQAGESVGQLANVQAKTANALEESVGQLSESYKNSAKAINNSGSNIQQHFDQLSANNKEYSQKLGDVTKNLSAINSAYELQLQGLNSQAEASQALTKGMGEIKAQFEQSAADAQIYKDQVAQLSKTVTELNTIYGNMLSAMNVGNK
ncbi:type IX secretion system motor protein PorL/GldL [Carboxylicivirga linearis]|uniref:Gliding motility protein GldL n=1 Tax=Carboxylicivirga linearis TaxID=1628157 RepID=A0ABS5JTM7_9BACT|nr:gliding motility protein GldL [Carboxylicivirga linearis]MBS2098202.1 gliding motility protein GldL [Carboxylicivirga linearis]